MPQDGPLAASGRFARTREAVNAARWPPGCKWAVRENKRSGECRKMAPWLQAGRSRERTMKLDIVNTNNENVGSLELKDDLFSGRVKSDLIWESVVQQNASQRRGTHATKTRAEVSGSGKKPWRQKGTGRARVGEVRNPLWRKGGTVFGPQPRSYEYQLPRKVEKGALRAALSAKLQGGDVVVVDSLVAGEVKTKAAVGMLKTIGVNGKALLVD